MLNILSKVAKPGSPKESRIVSFIKNTRIDNLKGDEKSAFYKKLRDIYEFQEHAKTYGARDPANLPKEDRDRVMVNFYLDYQEQVSLYKSYKDDSYERLYFKNSESSETV